MNKCEKMKLMPTDDEKVDILESRIHTLSPELLCAILKDRTTGKNILWATDNYRRYDNYRNKVKKFSSWCQIKPELITGGYSTVIKPRTTKARNEQKKRVKEKAEVFTPSWVCNLQNNLIDNAWFGFENAFNYEIERGWRVNLEKIDFGKCDKTWQDYVLDTRLEITCGEAPYLVSRYDTVTGCVLDIDNRIGMLDRKIRIINENINTQTKDDCEWLEWVKKAFQSIYGFEWQGDSILIARENILYTFCDYYKQKFKKEPSLESQLEIAEIISWNIWQMDGLKFVVPNTCTYEKKQEFKQFSLFADEEVEPQLELCEGCRTNNHLKHNGVYCIIKDWKKLGTKKKSRIRFVDCLDKDFKSGGKR